MRRKELLLIILLFFLLNLIVFGGVISGCDRLISHGFSGDVFSYFGALKSLEKDSLQNTFLLWNPYFFCGTPWIANPQNQFFYPLNFILLFLPFNLLINYSFMLHILLIGIATCIFVKYLDLDWYAASVSGLTAMFSGLVFLRCFAGHLLTINTYFWLPVIFLFLEMALKKRRLAYAIYAGVALGFQILAGNPQYTYYSVLAVVLYFVFRSAMILYRHKSLSGIKFNFSCLFIFLIIGIGIAALKLIPVWEFSRLSNRSLASYDFNIAYSFPPRNLITYLLPEFYGDALRVPYWGPFYYLWEMCGYVGILPLILSALAVVYRRNKYTIFFGALALLALLLSLGGYTPFFKLFYYFLPGIRYFRGPGKALVLFVFSVGILSAYGFSWLAQKRQETARPLKRIIILLGILAAALLFIDLFVYFRYSSLVFWWTNLWKIKNLPLVLSEYRFYCAILSLAKFTSLIIIIFLTLLLWQQKKISLNIFKFLLVVIIVGDLWLFGAKYIVSGKAQMCYWDRGVVNFLKGKEGDGLYRVHNYYLNSANNAAFDKISIIDGYDPLVLKRYGNFFDACFSAPGQPSCIAKLSNMVNLKYFIVFENQKVDGGNSKVVYQKDGFKILENTKCLPRAYIVHNAKVVKAGEQEVLRAVFDDSFEPLKAVILEKDIAPSGGNTGASLVPQDKATFLKYSANEVIIQAQAADSGYLILSDANYPGWRADVLNTDTGKWLEKEILNADYLFRAVVLDKGNYVVRFRFRPFSFYLGSIISVFTLVLVSVILFFIYRRNRRQRR